MTGFVERKRKALHRMECNDRSKKGAVDEPIEELVDNINSKRDYYTTSSCSGRILLLHEPPSRKKNMHEWPYVTHEQATAEPFIKALGELKGSEGRVWFRMQTCILHVACRDIEAARKLLGAFYSHGWKRSGIFSMEHDVVVELLSVEGIDVPVMDSGRLLVPEDYLSVLVELANDKLRVAHEKIISALVRLEQL